VIVGQVSVGQVDIGQVGVGQGAVGQVAVVQVAVGQMACRSSDLDPFALCYAFVSEKRYVKLVEK
jgi:hypothetical protein